MANRNDVAKLAGVSPTIVSYTLNNSNYVSAEKRQAVLEAVEKLNYHPNYIARSLKTRKTYNFAMLGNDIRNQLFAEYLYYMEQYSFANGYQITMCTARNEDNFIDILMNRQFDGIYMISNIFSSAQLNKIASNNIPIVLSKTHDYEELDPRIIIIAADSFNNMKKATEYLIKLGHRQIVYFPPLHFSQNDMNVSEYRLAGYKQAHMDYGLPVDDRLICMDTRSLDRVLEYSTYILKSSAVHPTAFVAGNDYLAVHVMKHLEAMSIRIPQDISIIGLDNTLYSQITTPSLTTVDIPKKKIAGAVVDALLRSIKGHAVKNIYFEGDLIIRDSTRQLSDS